MADMTVEITTSRAISPQILRHRSFSFQEFSQRYAEPTEVEIYSARSQDKKNRQNSFDDLSPENQKWFHDAQEQAIHRGIAKESARMLLPLSTQTKLYMKGSKEHRDIAEEIKKIFVSVFPNIGLALKWNMGGSNA
ncbi:hypothetical protein CHS0354_023943 [Potamilus streckersoni]|uniref:Uncharacterized protein n=1 Tax=Potamilus streckersoni TaxID=2493646 RepID=A0AAE0RZJ4_9BIVA|nr:hypothetical protein CHS0354_023943 [Potamilus streckersoni]